MMMIGCIKFLDIVVVIASVIAATISYWGYWYSKHGNTTTPTPISIIAVFVTTLDSWYS
jgi:hypothetical protein